MDHLVGTAITKQFLELAAFAALQAKEVTDGFWEKPSGGHRFFHGGETRSWEGLLSGAQIASITRDHRGMMERMNYPL